MYPDMQIKLTRSSSYNANFFPFAVGTVLDFPPSPLMACSHVDPVTPPCVYCYNSNRSSFRAHSVLYSRWLKINLITDRSIKNWILLVYKIDSLILSSKIVHDHPFYKPKFKFWYTYPCPGNLIFWIRIPLFGPYKMNGSNRTLMHRGIQNDSVMENP